ncbi:cation channel sperm-associated auxiliary subunit gamma-like isoform X2 [Alosa alosa]|uniref:cation channel sperm-associated auxiliary subunit gamma-like isoform X2 n=1 Tax=Alosa alosa TaxID=278164 RepID=UPI0020150E5C|nr:cation channel sperm-associated auxiliary subunit gamma-like isoform X2 [Alosa alosa]
MHFSLVLPILSLMFGATKVDACVWAVKLCELGDPLTSLYVCNINLDHMGSGGMEKQKLSLKVNPVIKSLTDQPVDTEHVTYYGFPYYVRINLDCGDEQESVKAMQKALFIGLNPSAILSVVEPVHPTLLKPQRLNIIMTSAPLHDDVPCDSELCQFGWYVPMPIVNGSVVYRMKVMSNGQGFHVPEKSFALNVNGIIQTRIERSQEVSFGTQWSSFEVFAGSPSRPLWSTADNAPVMVLAAIPNYKGVLITSSEFDHSTLIEVAIESCWVGSMRCPQAEFALTIQEAIAFESTVFIRQNQLLHQFVGNYSLLALQASSSDAWEQVLRSFCVEKLVPVPTSNTGNEFFYILGGGADMGTLYRADIHDGDATFTELRDTNGRTICEYMVYSLGVYEICLIRWVTHRADEDGTSIVLAKFYYSRSHWTYHVVLHDQNFHLHGKLPKYVPEDTGDSFIVVNSMTPDKSTANNIYVIMIGIVYNPNSGILYLWGNCLICSFDEGKTFLFVRGFPTTRSIKYFSLSYHGEFAFVTYHEEVWWGQEGVDTVIRVKPSPGYFVFGGLQSLKGFKKYMWPTDLVTVFWDIENQLQEVVYYEVKRKAHLVKRNLPVAEILSYNLFTEMFWTEQGSYNFFNFPRTCPFFWEYLEDLPQPEPYSRIQQYTARPPLVTHPSGIQTTTSLATYQGLLYHLLKLHSEYIQDIGDPAQNPISRLLMDKMVLEDYFFYMSSNGISSSGYSVEMDSFSRMYTNPEIYLPDKVYLDLHTSYSFSVYINAGNPAVSRDEIKNIWISAEVSDNDFLHAIVTRHEFFNRASIVYKVTVSDRGAFPGQALAGYGLRPFTLLLKVLRSEGRCFQDTDRAIVSQGQQRITVYIGCPPVFYPFFLIQDMVSGESGPFLGSYTFKVVGGGAYSRKNIRYFTSEEILLYNSYNHSSKQTLTLMWTYEGTSVNKTQEGFEVLSGTNNKIRWLCEKNSPCGDLSAQGLMAPDFFFIIEVSNKGVDMNTYCDYALRFEIHVHGFPLDPTRALYFMLMTLATIGVILFCYIVFHCCGPGLKTLGKAAYQAAKEQPHIERESSLLMDEPEPMTYTRVRR